MEVSLLSSLSFLIFLLIQICRASSQVRAGTPPRGWNSYDSFSWTISEEEFLKSANIVAQRLKPSGYEYVVVDYLWYRRKVPGAYADSSGFDVLDEWGRPTPDPGRWPSSKNGKGFTEVAKKVHSMGLKFGIHIMRGLSIQAFNANTPILDVTTGRAYEESGKHWRAQDIGLKEKACAWMPHGFMSVNAELGAGKAFLRSLLQQYADWGVDFVKHDCVFGEDLDIKEIRFVSEVLKGLKQPIVYSLSPGTSVTPDLAKQVAGLVNMYRITGDDWDTWSDVVAHFNISRDLAAANLIGANGLQGKSWPDLDMLPLGWLTDPGSNEGPHRTSKLSLDEQRTQMTLWSMCKSPLMFGGDVRRLDDTTYSLITNPTLLEINSYSSFNKEFPYITSTKDSQSIIRALRTQKTRHQTAVRTSDAHSMGLTSCKDAKASGWSIKVLDQDLEQICWKENSRRKSPGPFCLYKRKSPLALDDDMKHKQRHEGKLHLLGTDSMEFCLDMSPKQRLTSREVKRGAFSPCKWDANQMWELQSNGTLMNSYSGLCAVVKSVKDDIDVGGIRSWIATGRHGEVYVAFFNLNAKKTVISASISDLLTRLWGRSHFKDTCEKCREVWSGKDCGPGKKTLSTPVEMHGCALFVLKCR